MTINGLKTDKEFKDRFERLKVSSSEKKNISVEMVLKGQYKEAYEDMMNAYNAKLTCGLVGPVGCGKTLLCRYFAKQLQQDFEWITFTDLIRPSTLIGSLDPAIAFKEGINLDTFIPGVLTRSVVNGSILLGNEINRGDEYTLNTFLDPLEEKMLYIPQLKQWIKVDERFYFIAAMNPSEHKGTRKLPEAFKSRIGVWIKLDYPEKNVEREIIEKNCSEYTIPIVLLDYLVEFITVLRQDRFIERPPSLRSAIQVARFCSEKARKAGKSEPNKDLMKESILKILPEHIEMQDPNREPYNYIKEKLNQYY